MKTTRQKLVAAWPLMTLILLPEPTHAVPGALDLSFNPGTGANNIVNSFAVQTNGQVFIGGLFTTVNGTNINRIARLNADGSLDTSFDPGTGAANYPVRSVVVQPDGKVLIGGEFTAVNGNTNRSFLARLNGDG